VREGGIGRWDKLHEFIGRLADGVAGVKRASEGTTSDWRPRDESNAGVVAVRYHFSLYDNISPSPTRLQSSLF
jgi:hypothetical protein